MMKKLVCIVIALIMCASSLAVGVFADISDKAISGEITRAAFTLADGVDYVAYALGDPSQYGASGFCTVSVDVSRGDLLTDKAQSALAYSQSTGRKTVASIETGAKGGESFALEGGAICFASANASYAFGVSASGKAMIGKLAASVEIVDRDAGSKVIADKVEKNDGLKLSTAQAAEAQTFSAVIDCASDALLVPGVPVDGVVTAIAKGETEAGGASLVVTASKDELDAFAPGDRVTVTADVADGFENTPAWRTVEKSIGSSSLLVKDGKIQFPDTNEPVSPSAIGILPDGRAMILSLNGTDRADALKLASLCAELGMTDAIGIDAEGAIVISTDADGGALLPDVPDPVQLASQIGSPLWYVKHMKAQPADDTAAIPADNAAGENADAPCAGTHSDAAADAAYDGYTPTNTLYKQIEFDSTGEWLTLVINESDVEAWYGKIF